MKWQMVSGYINDDAINANKYIKLTTYCLNDIFCLEVYKEENAAVSGSILLSKLNFNGDKSYDDIFYFYKNDALTIEHMQQYLLDILEMELISTLEDIAKFGKSD